MNQPVAVRVPQAFGDLLDDPHRLLHRELTLAEQAVPKRLAVDVGHDVVEDPVGLARIEDGQDVGMAQAGGDPDFPKEALGADRHGEVGAQQLDRDHPLVPEVAGQEHGGHAAPSELAHEGIAARQGRAETLEDVGHIVG